MAKYVLTLLVVLFAIRVSCANVETKLTVDIVFLSVEEPEHLPLSLVYPPIDDFGLPGAELALKENSTTGGFLGHAYNLSAVKATNNQDLITQVAALLQDGSHIFVGDLSKDQWVALSQQDFFDRGLFFNSRSPDQILRGQHCHANFLHIAPSRQMLADGLAQYLIYKKWTNWLLLSGKSEEDKAFAEAIKVAAEKFRGEIVDEIEWQFETGSRRADSGHTNAQKEVPLGTQTRKEYDILVVADEHDNFGEYLSYLTSKPRPVAGTHGLIATDWDRVNENWGATQVQRRFAKSSGRFMTSRDYAAWVAVRALGEAVTRSETNDWQALRDYLMAPEFDLAAFKGVPVSFRHWNGQLRQPILLAGPKMLVSVSPQAQFLHERNLLDTMGFDDVESDCSAYAN